jgi:hypothetical protein
MKLLIFLVIITLILKISLNKRLKIKTKRTKTKESVIQLKYAIGDAYKNRDSSHQFFDNGKLIENLTILYNTQYQDIINGLNDYVKRINKNEEEMKTHELEVKRVKIYRRPFFSAFHEYLMICAFDEARQREHYLVIDRGAMEDLISTKVRIIYTGKLDQSQRETKQLNICDTRSSEWAEFRGVSNGHVDSDLLGEHPTESLRIRYLQDLILAVMQYAINYPEYGLISTNCQHFATGFFNAVSFDEIKKKKISNPKLSFLCQKKVAHADILDDILMQRVN